jgi:hypothetical protein
MADIIRRVTPSPASRDPIPMTPQIPHMLRIHRFTAWRNSNAETRRANRVETSRELQYSRRIAGAAGEARA